ncbi:MAG: DUF3341 domain-containing protein [bacterium]|nr:DUF3341 domain-containing protein [bacterium]
MENRKKLHGLLVEFDDSLQLLGAAAKVRDKGFKHWDVHTPCPVHGLDEAMGIKPTILPWIVLGAGLTGLGVAVLMQWWMNAVDYPYLISGKPLFSLPANIPVMFELTILFSAVTCVVSLFALNDLPKWFVPQFKSQRFRRVTTDRFFIYIDAADPKFHAQKTMEFAKTLGGLAVEEVEDSPCGN